MSDDEERLRARVFLRAVLPLVRVLAEHRTRDAWWTPRARGAIELSLRDGSLAATLRCDGAAVVVEPTRCAAPDLRWRFRDARAMNAFFLGQPALPEITPWGGIAAPLLSLRALSLLLGLRVLDPRNNPPTLSSDEKLLRVQLLLGLVTRAMAELHRSGWEPARALTKINRERVFQWSVAGTSVAAFLRVDPTRACAGSGEYTAREPFVHTVFRDAECAFAALTATASQMEGFRGGAVVTHGSPEYARKVSRLMQQVDALLTGA